MLKIVLLIFLFGFPQILFADVCEIEEPYGADLIQIEAQFSDALSLKNYSEIYSKA